MMLALCLLLICWTPHFVLASQEYSTNGTSGIPCGEYQCLATSNTTCDPVTNKCVCANDTEHGIGHFLCVEEDSDFAIVFSDPMVRGFDGSHTKIPLVCKFLATHVTSALRVPGSDPITGKSSNGSCDTRVFAWGRRKAGKTFVWGVQVNFMVWLGNLSFHHATRVYGQAVNGQYTYVEDGNTNPFGEAPYGDPVTTDIPGYGTIHTVYDGRDNFVRILAAPCGVEIGFRGVEVVGSTFQQPPGMYVAVNRLCGPTYLSQDNSLFSPPVGQGLSIAEQAQIASEMVGFPVSTYLLAVYKAFTGQHMQDFPDAPSQLQMLADTIQQCNMDSVYQAMNYCLFTIESTKFLRCYDNTSGGAQAIALMDECTFSLCDSNPFMCLHAQTAVSNSSCPVTNQLGLASILDFDCDSLA